MAKNLVVDAIVSGRMLPEDFQKIPGVQQIRDMARDIFPRFRAWRLKSRSSYWNIYHNPYAMGLHAWEQRVLRYVRDAVHGILKGDDIYTYYMCAMAYHNLLAMSVFLRDRPRHRKGLTYKMNTPEYETVSLVDRLLASEFGEGKTRWTHNPSISEEFISDDDSDIDEDFSQIEGI